LGLSGQLIKLVEPNEILQEYFFLKTLYAWLVFAGLLSHVRAQETTPPQLCAKTITQAGAVLM